MKKVVREIFTSLERPFIGERAASALILFDVEFAHPFRDFPRRVGVLSSLLKRNLHTQIVAAKAHSSAVSSMILVVGFPAPMSRTWFQCESGPEPFPPAPPAWSPRT